MGLTRTQWLQIGAAALVFLGLALWFPHSPMVNDLRSINGMEREAAVSYLISNQYLMPHQDKEAMMQKYGIKESELDITRPIATHEVSPGARAIQQSPILRFLLGYPPPEAEP